MFTVENLAVRLGDKNILQNVHFTIDTPGQLVGILGANGSGKTTLLRAVAGLLPHTGCCLMDGVPLESLSTRCLAQTVSYIPQQSGISVSMSAREVVLMGCNPRLGVLQSPTAAMCAAAEEALRTVGLVDKAEQDYLTLSGGERQLCILARTFVEDAPLLLLDEPDSALDLANRSHMAALLAEFVHASGKTALICLHDPMLMLDWCDTLIVLQNGQVGAMLYPRTDPVEALQSALAAVYGPLELVPATDRTGRVRLALLCEKRKMKPKIHVMLCDDIGERFFGEGPCRLLHRIEETGSLRAAAQAMGLSYSKALRMVKRAEKELGFALTRKTIGGRGGGGSTLTDEARNFMERYEAYRDACVQTDRELYYKFFPGER